MNNEIQSLFGVENKALIENTTVLIYCLFYHLSKEGEKCTWEIEIGMKNAHICMNRNKEKMIVSFLAHRHLCQLMWSGYKILFIFLNHASSLLSLYFPLPSLLCFSLLVINMWVSLRGE